MRIHIKIALLLFALMNGCQCPREEASMVGEEAPAGANIANGVPAEPGDAPWQVSLFRSNGTPLDSHFCGGSIVDSFWILTACHCTLDGKNELSPDEIKVYYNSIFLDSLGDVAEVDTIIRHHGYNRRNLEYDLALLRLKEPIKFKDGHSTIVKIDPSIDPEEVPLSPSPVVFGWGDNPGYSGIKNRLMRLSIPIIPFDTCKRKNVRSGEIGLTINMFCAGNDKGEYSPCDRDSGGAIITSMNDTICQFGLVCKALPCGMKGRYPVFTSLYDDMGTWVSTTIEKH